MEEHIIQKIIIIPLEELDKSWCKCVYKNDRRLFQDFSPYIHITANYAILEELQEMSIKEVTYLANLDGKK